MTAAPAMAVSCASGHVCLFTRTGLRGTQYNIPVASYSEGKNYRLTTWYPNLTYLGSVWNNWSDRIYLNQLTNSNNGGYSLCYPRGGQGSPDLLVGEDLNWIIFGVPTAC
jgi:hypothetical protein